MTKKQPFVADQFTPTKWDTAEDKAWFASQFAKFVESEFSKNYFTKRFYSVINGCFGFIAHYDIHGFWREYFKSDADRLRFVQSCVDHVPVGDPTYTHSDVELTLIRWLISSGTCSKWQLRVGEDIEERERAELARLKEKYE